MRLSGKGQVQICIRGRVLQVGHVVISEYNRSQAAQQLGVEPTPEYHYTKIQTSSRHT